MVKFRRGEFGIHLYGDNLVIVGSEEVSATVWESSSEYKKRSYEQSPDSNSENIQQENKDDSEKIIKFAG